MQVTFKPYKSIYEDTVFNNVSNIKTNGFLEGGGYITITHTEDNGNVCEVSLDLNDFLDFEITE